MHVMDLENCVCGDRDFTKYNMKLIQEQQNGDHLFLTLYDWINIIIQTSGDVC